MDSTHPVTSWSTGCSIARLLSAGLTPLFVYITTGCLLVSSAASAPEDYGLSTNREHQAIVNITFVDPVSGELRSDGIEIGRFGSESRLDTEWGVVVHIRTIDNRTDGCNSPPINAPSERWIALIERGACNFQLKIHNAAIVSNASAVVVYNHQDDSSLITMKHTVDDVVSIFVTKRYGERIASLVDNGTRVFMHITVGPALELHIGNVNRTSVLFVSISFIVLMVISLAWLVFYYVQRFRYAHTKDRLTKRLTNSAKKAVGKMPQKTLRRGDKETDPDFDLCAICVESYKAGDVVRILPCKHLFHKSCVDPWLIDQRSCPICKLDILHAYGICVMGGKESTSTDTDTQFMFSDVTDFLLAVGDVRDIHVAEARPQAASAVPSSSSAATVAIVENDESATVNAQLLSTTQRMSALQVESDD